MMRILHRWLGLVLTVLLLVTALSSGAVAVPALESARTVQPEAADRGRSGRAGASGAPGSGTDRARPRDRSAHGGSMATSRARR